MKLWIKTSIAIFLALALAGCAVSKYEEAQNTNPTGDGFTSALYSYYTERSEHEWGYGNYRDADRFAAKAIRAAGGENVEPMEMDQRSIPPAKAGELAEGRRMLMEALDATGRQKLPDSAAKAQVMWECWFEELEESRQPTHIDQCREDFWAALNAVQLALQPEPAPPVAAPAPPPPAEPAEFVVFFDFDRSDIRADQDPTMDVVIAAANAAPDRAVHIIGRTDTTGSIDYNQALSERRTNQVIGALIEAGIDRGRISGESVGQTRLRVSTEDGVNEPANRVATITLF